MCCWDFSVLGVALCISLLHFFPVVHFVCLDGVNLHSNVQNSFFFFFLHYGLIPRKVWNASASHLCHHIPIRKPVVISAGKHAKIFLWSCDKLKESILLITCKRACDDKQNSCSRPLSLFDELLSCLPGSDLFEPETPKPRKTCSHVSVYRWVFHQEC